MSLGASKTRETVLLKSEDSRSRKVDGTDIE